MGGREMGVKKENRRTHVFKSEATLLVPVVNLQTSQSTLDRSFFPMRPKNTVRLHSVQLPSSCTSYGTDFRKRFSAKRCARTGMPRKSFSLSSRPSPITPKKCFEKALQRAGGRKQPSQKKKMGFFSYSVDQACKNICAFFPPPPAQRTPPPFEKKKKKKKKKKS